MKTKTSFQKYLCVDPSFFSSIKRFETLPAVLDNLKSSDSKIVLPSLLRSLSPFRNDLNEKIPTDNDVVSLLRKWNPFFNKKNETEYQSLQEKLVDFFATFKPIFADELVGDLEKIGPRSIHLSNVLEKLGHLVGKTIFELMAVCSEKSGIILSYGRQSITFIRKIFTPALEGYSNLKHSMIDSGEAPEFLKIIGFAFSAPYVSDFINHFDIVGIPIPLSAIGELGLAVIADG